MGNQHDGEPARANGPACFVFNLNVPNVQFSAFMVQPCCTGDPARLHAAQVVRIDFDAHGSFAFRTCNEVRAYRPQGLGQYNTGSAMQQPIGLMGPGIHGHLTDDSPVFHREQL